MNTGAYDTDTHVTLRVGSSFVIPLGKHLAGTKGKVENVKECVVHRQGREEGRRLDRFYVIICINAMQLQVQFISHFLPLSSGFHFHTHAFRLLLRARHVRDVTPERAASRI
jgi:hypothetical protein